MSDKKSQPYRYRGVEANRRSEKRSSKNSLERYHETLKIHPDSPSLDKVVPELGYTKGNVRFVTYHVNVCLLDMGEDILRDLCEDIINRERGV